MGKKRKAGGGSGSGSARKRKTGFLGFESGEIAFIEDEMAALAQEYGLEVDNDVAAHVQQRTRAKKTARRRKLPASTASKASSVAPEKTVRLLTTTEPAKKRKEKDTQDLGPVDEHKLVQKRLDDVMPENCALRACAVPGCSCGNGSRSMGLNETDDSSRTDKDTLKVGQCLKCQHGVLQHSVVLREDADAAATTPSGGQRLLGVLYQLVRLARLSSSVYKSRVWTNSTLALLTDLLTHLKRQFAAGGTQNGQKSTDELRQEHQLLTELQSQLRKAEQAVGTATRDELPIMLACVCDQMYFQTYYTALVLYGRACGAVPPPEAYLKELERFTPESATQLENFLNRELSGSGIPSNLVEALALPVVDVSGATEDALARERLRVVEQENENPLLAIHHARLREGIRLFYEEGVGMSGELDAVLAAPKGSEATVGGKPRSSKKKPQKKHYRREKNSASTVKGDGETDTKLVEMPSYPLLAQWRNNCRDWCCHLYAYATPTREALDLLATYAPIVEMGAGTGYWSSLLQRAGVEVAAYDKCPPGSEETAGNAYHGHVPAFCSVGRGGPEVLNQAALASHSLLLCYPPPGDAMAVRSVQLFQGDVVLHVGEWQGDTGDRRFENELQRRFVLERELALPNWGNSAYALTVWRRKKLQSSEVEGESWRALSCFKCRKTLEDAAAECEPLRRCVVCKTNVYCSAQCAQRDAVGHAAEHAARLVFLEEPTSDMGYERQFENEAFFRELEAPDLDDTVVAVKSDWHALVKADEQSDSAEDSGEGGSEESEAEAEAESQRKTPAKGGFAFNFSA